MNTPEETMRQELALQTPLSLPAPLPPHSLALLRALNHSFLWSTCCFPPAHPFPPQLLCSLSSGLNVFPSPSTTDLSSKHVVQPLPSLLCHPGSSRCLQSRSITALCVEAQFPVPGKQHSQPEPRQGERVLPAGTRPPDFSFQALAIVSICHGR